MAIEREPAWVAICTVPNCSLFGIEYPCDDAQLECGGCNTIYEQPK